MRLQTFLSMTITIDMTSCLFEKTSAISTFPFLGRYIEISIQLLLVAQIWARNSYSFVHRVVLLSHALSIVLSFLVGQWVKTINKLYLKIRTKPAISRVLMGGSFVGTCIILIVCPTKTLLENKTIVKLITNNYSISN